MEILNGKIFLLKDNLFYSLDFGYLNKSNVINLMAFGLFVALYRKYKVNVSYLFLVLLV